MTRPLPAREHVFPGWMEAGPVGFPGLIAAALGSGGIYDRVLGLTIDLIPGDASGSRLASECCRPVP